MSTTYPFFKKNFVAGEKRTFDLNLPTFEENLASSIHSYNHAIRLLTENGDKMRASGLGKNSGWPKKDNEG